MHDGSPTRPLGPFQNAAQPMRAWGLPRPLQCSNAVHGEGPENTTREIFSGLYPVVVVEPFFMFLKLRVSLSVLGIRLTEQLCTTHGQRSAERVSDHCHRGSLCTACTARVHCTHLWWESPCHIPKKTMTSSEHHMQQNTIHLKNQTRASWKTQSWPNQNHAAPENHQREVQKLCHSLQWHPVVMEDGCQLRRTAKDCSVLLIGRRHYTALQKPPRTSLILIQCALPTFA